MEICISKLRIEKGFSLDRQDNWIKTLYRGVNRNHLTDCVMIMVGSWMAKLVVCLARYYSVNKLNNTARKLWHMHVPDWNSMVLNFVSVGCKRADLASRTIIVLLSSTQSNGQSYGKEWKIWSTSML